jgi:thyrotropin-releasing hormone receptor
MKEHKQKTLMLFAVCFLLFISELPQAILILISIYSDFYFLNVYKPLSDFLDMLILITYPINFFIYCLMSRSFRKEFKRFFSK